MQSHSSSSPRMRVKTPRLVDLKWAYAQKKLRWAIVDLRLRKVSIRRHGRVFDIYPTEGTLRRYLSYYVDSLPYNTADTIKVCERRKLEPDIRQYDRFS